MEDQEYSEWCLLYFHAGWWKHVNKKDRRKLRRQKRTGIPIGMEPDNKPVTLN